MLLGLCDSVFVGSTAGTDVTDTGSTGGRYCEVCDAVGIEVIASNVGMDAIVVDVEEVGIDIVTVEVSQATVEVGPEASTMLIDTVDMLVDSLITVLSIVAAGCVMSIVLGGCVSCTVRVERNTSVAGVTV